MLFSFGRNRQGVIGSDFDDGYYNDDDNNGSTRDRSRNSRTSKRQSSV